MTPAKTEAGWPSVPLDPIVRLNTRAADANCLLVLEARKEKMAISVLMACDFMTNNDSLFFRERGCLTSEFTGLRGFSRRSGGMMGVRPTWA